MKANRSAIVEQCCLTDSHSEVEFVLNEYPELSSIPQHLSEPNFVAAGYADKKMTKIPVPGVPLWELLRRHGAPPVIVPEPGYRGFRVDRTQGFPIDEFRILCMTIERGGRSYDKLRAKLRHEGYRLVRAVVPDDFYVHESVGYKMTSSEHIRTRLVSTWNSLYFHEPMLTVRRIARSVRRVLRGH